MTQIDKDRWHSMAECYDQMAEYLVPKYAWLQDEVLALVRAAGDPRLVVDLGAGSGRFLEKVLKASPATHAVWVDFSEDFQRVAERRLRPFEGRVTFVRGAMEGDWPAALPQAPDVVCSASTIHHLETAAKWALYARCLKVLRPGGWFYNTDEMSTPYADAYRRTLDYWVTYVERARGDVPPALKDDERQWCEKFAHWKERNVDLLGRPKQAGDDLHESYVTQMAWLHEAGFVNVDLFLKFQLWAVIGGQKPTDRP